MDEERNVYDEVLEEALNNLKSLEPGSEEFERQAKAIAEMDKAKTERLKAEGDQKTRKGQFLVNLGQVVVGGIGAGVTVLGILMQRRTNKDVMKVEETDVITSKAFDNKKNFR